MRTLLLLTTYYLLLTFPLCSQEIRVLLHYINRDELAIEVPEGGFLVNQGNGEIPVSHDGTIELSDGLIIKSKDGHKLYWQGKNYRGHLEVRRINGKYALVNSLELDDYLAGVLASELDTKTWPMETIKVQAVVSRSYAVNLINERRGKPYDLGAKANHQVYFGATFEDPRAREAVKATLDEVLADGNNEVLPGYFHSCCGGYTEDPQTLWSEEGPKTVRGVSDFGFCKTSPHYHWVTTLASHDLEAALDKLGYKLGLPVERVSLGALSRSARVLTLKIITEKERFEVPMAKLREILGPNWIRSTKITDIRKKDDRFLIYGLGWGHGVGLCQWGARSMAERGWNYKKILKHYFPKAKLAKI